MRGGICSIQLQALTPEAATVVKQAVSLATRRGHAQVTPLHVASAMLAASAGLLRKACLQCHSHPLQCKALELCFNVALNRLPASTQSPLLAPHHQYSSTPSLSNALVAAFKRAQAHQRRGSIENQQQQQQHILALKIEVEQLIISILDDPSVSRVMREAGFSSTVIKARVEQALSMEVSSQKESKESSIRPHQQQQVLGNGSNNNNVSASSRPFDQLFMKNDDDEVVSVLNELVKRRRNTVIVGESLSNVEGVAKGVMEKFEVGNVPMELRYVQFVSLPLMYFRNISKEEVENKMMEIRSLVRSYVGRGLILYLGDLKWLFDFWSTFCSDESSKNLYCSLEHMVMEIKKLVCENNNGNRVWLLGISSFKTYMKCKISHPSLESIWELHPFTIPVGSLSLTLNFDSDFQGQERSNALFKNLTCCRDCSLNFEKEAQSITNNVSRKVSSVTTTTTLPTWLQNCKKEDKILIIEDEQENTIRLKEVCKKWNSFCNSVHNNNKRQISSSIHEKPVLFGSSTPSSPTSVSSSHELLAKSNNTHHHQSQHLINWPIISISTEEKVEPIRECELLYTENGSDENCCYDGNNLIMFMPDHREDNNNDNDNNALHPKPDLLSNPNSSPNSASSSEAVEGLDSTQMFKELNAENLKILSDALDRKVLHLQLPQHNKGKIVHEIASTILQCRSGMMSNKNRLVKREEEKQETWMVFLGLDHSSNQAKESVSKEIAKAVFGSYANFVTISMSNFLTDESKHCNKKKRPRNEFGSSYLQRFGEAVNENPHRVFFMEDLDQVDNFSQKGIKKAIESGSLMLPACESVPLKDAIVIFSCESFFSSSSSSKPSSDECKGKGKENGDDDDNKMEEKSSMSLCLDLNIAIEDDASRGGDIIGILELVDKQINFSAQELS
ncbi:protein SMAX1-LIKE 3 isoform X1 [Arachis hypogaea]|uniref:Clp R domain-containing protein n=1 Tax=Arachis hypogaea TaxID=3818 RepID=A0A445BGV3_ARAHY|nr:protein SMAX1-LIKE 3 isoform X1 [Arachis hypogaea]QHO35432.1 uncharacterized protein DS421_9g275420 [Arachis hypogaea]RYR37879.1 hypothetical protein Ahy_A09g042795 [Arachis hypogaea]